MSRLPVTKSRSALSIRLFFIQSSYLTPDVLKMQGAQISNFKPMIIDVIEKFSENEIRETDSRYETDADVAGNVVGRVRRTTTKTISIDRTVMYKDDINDKFDVGIELIEQQLPFAILKVEHAPAELHIEDKVTLFLGCFIHSIPKTFELGRDLKVVQAITMGYTEKVFMSGQIVPLLNAVAV